MPDHFLARAGWGAAIRTPLAGDASGRRYTRLSLGTDRAVLMESRTIPVGPFLRVQKHLEDLGLSVPQIIARSEEHGFVLMEDLGNAIFARRIEADPALELPLGEAAVDWLATLHEAPVPGWASAYDPDALVAALEPAWSEATPPGGPAKEAAETFHALLTEHAGETSVLLHRDFHAENLLWLPGRQGLRRVGVIDFQDALAGHPAYDLASFAQDARRDVSAEIEARLIRRFCAVTGRDPEAFAAAYALQSLQRNTRILGLFARLAGKGKRGYLAYVPRVRAYVERSLAHPVAAPLRAPLRATVLAPEIA